MLWKMVPGGWYKVRNLSLYLILTCALPCLNMCLTLACIFLVIYPTISYHTLNLNLTSCVFLQLHYIVCVHRMSINRSLRFSRCNPVNSCVQSVDSYRTLFCPFPRTLQVVQHTQSLISVI